MLVVATVATPAIINWIKTLVALNTGTNGLTGHGNWALVTIIPLKPWSNGMVA